MSAVSRSAASLNRTPRARSSPDGRDASTRASLTRATRPRWPGGRRSSRSCRRRGAGAWAGGTAGTPRTWGPSPSSWRPALVAAGLALLFFGTAIGRPPVGRRVSSQLVEHGVEPAQRVSVCGWSPGHSPRLRSPPQTRAQSQAVGLCTGARTAARRRRCRAPSARARSSPRGRAGTRRRRRRASVDEQLADLDVERRLEVLQAPRAAQLHRARGPGRSRGCPRRRSPGGGRPRRAVRGHARRARCRGPRAVPSTCTSREVPGWPIRSRTSIGAITVTPPPRRRTAVLVGARRRPRRRRTPPRRRWSARRGASRAPARPGRACGRAAAPAWRLLLELAQRDLELRELGVDVVLGLEPHFRASPSASCQDPLGLLVARARRPPPCGPCAAAPGARPRPGPRPRAGPSPRRSSRSFTTHRACLISSGSDSRISATSSSTSSRLSRAEEDRGIDFASRTRSSSCCRRAARSISATPAAPSAAPARRRARGPRRRRRSARPP